MDSCVKPFLFILNIRQSQSVPYPKQSSFWENLTVTWKHQQQKHCHIATKAAQVNRPSGFQGTTSKRTKLSVNMILNRLKYLEALVKEHNSSYTIDLHTCLTVQVENLHAMGHFKDQFPTALQYARNLVNTDHIRKH